LEHSHTWSPRILFFKQKILDQIIKTEISGTNNIPKNNYKIQNTENDLINDINKGFTLTDIE